MFVPGEPLGFHSFKHVHKLQWSVFPDPRVPPQAPACSRTHVLACTHPRTFARSPSPCSFLRARAQLESWLPPARFQKRLFIKKKKNYRKEIIIIITLRALAVKALRERGEGA